MTATHTDTDESVDDVELWNREDAAELELPTGQAAYDVAISARDWTVETIVQQIRQGNIDLDPAFQRRNAWRDDRRSRLIESFILSFPIPQIVLAEKPTQKEIVHCHRREAAAHDDRGIILRGLSRLLEGAQVDVIGDLVALEWRQPR